MNAILHHIGILVSDIPEAAQLYVSRFGYRIVSEIIHDPVQTAYVQFLQGAEPAPLVELVVADGPQSKLAGALKRGGGLNHLCYRSEDIQHDCQVLTSQGMLLLQAPVPAAAFPGSRIAWLMAGDGIPIELVEEK